MNLYLKHKYIGVYLVIITIGLCACDLNPVIDNTYSEDHAFGLPEKTEGFLMNAYANIPDQFDNYGGDFLDVATDNAVTNNFGGQLYQVGNGGLSPQHNPIGNWTNIYNQFRNIHTFMEKGLGPNVVYDIQDPDADMAMRMRLKGEAFFLRGWWGFQLLQLYGGKTDSGEALGYPIVLSSLSNEESQELENITRNTYEECVAQIKQDLDSAYVYLPENYRGNDPITGVAQLGRADKQTVLALESRVSLYAASPAYQPDEITQITSMGEFEVINRDAYEQKWVIAAEAAQEAIDFIGDFSSLQSGDFNKNRTPSEFIWRKYHRNRSLENRNYPISEFGKARTGPSQNLVDAFPMKDGYPIDDPRSDYDPQNPYENRDPRLYNTVMYNGQTLNGSPLEIFEGGKDSKTTHQKATRTGYYLRKWLSLDNGLLDIENPSNDHHYHVLMRKTELYLNFAEAANEAYGPNGVGAGLSQSAADVIKSIRSAAGITDNTYVDEIAAQGKEGFRKLIQNERRIELAFENHRFFDLRRNLLPLNKPVEGVKIERNEDQSLEFSTEEVEQRKFNDIRYYYLPLPYDEVVKSPGLVNNIGW